MSGDLEVVHSYIDFFSFPHWYILFRTRRMEIQEHPTSEEQDEQEHHPSGETNSREEEGDRGQNGSASQNECTNPNQTHGTKVTAYRCMDP